MAPKKMKQLIARIDPELHLRLKRRAEEEGRSLNALVTEALEDAADPDDARTELRARARRHGIRLVGGYEPVPDEERRRRNAERAEAVAATQGIGPILDRLIEEDRGPRE